MAEPAKSGGMRITRGVLSKRTGCNIETIRYYERIGLMPQPARSAGGHRLYTEGEERRLIFVRRARELGFTLEQVRDLLRLADEPGHSCAEVERLARAHLERIRTKLADLRLMESVLDETVARCAGGTAPDCPIMEVLSQNLPVRP